MKYAVGIMLTTFGTFWSVEGAGAAWPGSDSALFAILAFYLAVSWLLVAYLRSRRQRAAVEVAQT